MNKNEFLNSLKKEPQKWVIRTTLIGEKFLYNKSTDIAVVLDGKNIPYELLIQIQNE